MDYEDSAFIYDEDKSRTPVYAGFHNHIIGYTCNRAVISKLMIVEKADSKHRHYTISEWLTKSGLYEEALAIAIENIILEYLHECPEIYTDVITQLRSICGTKKKYMPKIAYEPIVRKFIHINSGEPFKMKIYISPTPLTIERMHYWSKGRMMIKYGTAKYIIPALWRCEHQQKLVLV